MRYSTTVGVDLAKNVIQIPVVSGRGKEQLNRSLTRKKFAEFLVKQKASLVAFESCASAHYWARAAERHGDKARIIPASRRAVDPGVCCPVESSAWHLVGVRYHYTAGLCFIAARVA